MVSKFKEKKSEKIDDTEIARIIQTKPNLQDTSPRMSNYFSHHIDVMDIQFQYRGIFL